MFVTDCFDDARYVLMRVIRLVALLTSDVVCAYSFLLFFRSAFWCLMNALGVERHAVWNAPWIYKVTMDQPLLGLVLCAGAFAAGWFCMYSLGLPYREATRKPGLNARRCHRCRIAVPDDWKCSHCGVFRFEKVYSSFWLLLSWIVTVLFKIHDCTLGLVTIILA